MTPMKIVTQISHYSDDDWAESRGSPCSVKARRRDYENCIELPVLERRELV